MTKGREHDIDLGDNGDLWNQVGVREKRAVEGRGKDFQRWGVCGGGLCLPKPVQRRGACFSLKHISWGLRTLSQVPTGEIIPMAGSEASIL